MGTDVNITATPGMQPVTTVTSGTGASSGTEQIVPSPATLGAMADSQASHNAATTAQVNVVPTVKETIEGKAAGQDLIQAQNEAANDERSKLIAAKMPAIQAAEKEAKAAEARYLNHTFYDYLSTRSKGDAIISDIAMGLVAGVNAYMGIPGNELADSLQKRIAQDFELQKIRLHSKENIAKWKREGVTDLYDHLQKELAALDVKQARALDATKAKAEAMALRAGIPEAQARENVVSATLDATAKDKRLEAVQRLDRHASSRKETSSSTSEVAGKGGGGVEADKNAMFFDLLNENGKRLAEQMPKLSASDVEAINRVSKLENFDAKNQTLSALAASNGIDIETGVSPAAKAYLADLQAYSQALGRLESGAAIGLEEKLDFKNKAMPKASDSADDRKMRADKLVKDIELRGGHVARAPRPMTSSPQAPADSDMVTIKSKKTGKTERVTREEAKRRGAIR